MLSRIFTIRLSAALIGAMPVALLSVFLSVPAMPGVPDAQATDVPESVIETAKTAIYRDGANTFYCGCPVTFGKSPGNQDTVNLAACGFRLQAEGRDQAGILAWDHIVPMGFLADAGDGEAVSRDLHNILPVERQIKLYRDRAMHGYVGHPEIVWGEQCLVRDSSGIADAGPHDRLEPQDCTKGDIGRTWLYVNDTYGIEIDDISLANFKRWNEMDPVSPAEKIRHDRIAAIQGKTNPYIDGIAPDSSGSCPWEK